jgi:hypothetical protein
MTELSAEQLRVAAILGLPETKGREASAKILAFSTDTSPEDAAKLLVTFQPEAEQVRRTYTSGGLSNLSARDLGVTVAAHDHGWGEVIEKLNIGVQPNGQRAGERRR